MSDEKIKLQKLREQIDAIDDQLLELLNKRASHVLEIGHIKKQENRQILVLEREESIYQRLVALNQGHSLQAPYGRFSGKSYRHHCHWKKNCRLHAWGPRPHFPILQPFSSSDRLSTSPSPGAFPIFLMRSSAAALTTASCLLKIPPKAL